MKTPRLPRGLPVRERIERSVAVDANGCWRWTLVKNRDGYGRIGMVGGQKMAHRMSYEAFRGDIPDGLTIDHLCRVRDCVNPEHLEPVTQRDNVLRGDGLPARQARQTSCLRGHPFDEANTYWTPPGGRACRACRRVGNRPPPATPPPPPLPPR
jgi:HNH endonuclease